MKKKHEAACPASGFCVYGFGGRPRSPCGPSSSVLRNACGPFPSYCPSLAGRRNRLCLCNCSPRPGSAAAALAFAFVLAAATVGLGRGTGALAAAGVLAVDAFALAGVQSAANVNVGHGDFGGRRFGCGSRLGRFVLEMQQAYLRHSLCNPRLPRPIAHRRQPS